MKLLGPISNLLKAKCIMIEMIRLEILNLETRYLLFCPFLVSHCKLDIMVLKLLTKSYMMFIKIVNTPVRRKQKQLCHINMLKKNIDRDSYVISSVNLVNSVPPEQNQMESEDINFVKSDPSSSKLMNS